MGTMRGRIEVEEGMHNCDVQHANPAIGEISIRKGGEICMMIHELCKHAKIQHMNVNKITSEQTWMWRTRQQTIQHE